MCKYVFYKHKFCGAGMLFFGLDIGTTNSKAVLLDGDGGLLDRITISISQDSESAMRWYDIFSKALDYFQDQGFLRGEKIIGSVTAQGGTFVLLNERFQPVSRVYSWTETAESDVANELVSSYGRQRYYHLTGWEPNGWLAGCKFKQLLDKKQVSEDYHYFSSVPDFIYAQITGKFVTDITSAQITGWCDFQNGKWAADMLGRTGQKEKNFPAIEPEIKVLFDEVSTRWGKISLVTSSHDQYAAMEAAELERDKGVMLGTGTAWVINGRSAAALFDDDYFMIHPGKDLYRDQFGYILGLGQVGKGFDELLKRFGINAECTAAIEKQFDEIDQPRQAIKIDIKKGIIDGEPKAETAIRRYMEWAGARAALMREKYVPVKSQDRIVMTGGAVKSRFWPQVISNLCQIKVEAVDFPEFTAYGAALHARKAVKAKGGPESGSKADSPGGRKIIYEPNDNGRYRKWYLDCQRPALVETLTTH